ncbi:MAG: PilZ domain-containing protein [Candidatus Hydrogenedentes bacterium]|nr:PilZ domain-containing protein [Candidatus Hydrogenedentota bacterium]
MDDLSKAHTYEHRRFSRVEVKCPATITLESGETVAAEIHDVSMCGVRFTPVNGISIGGPCTMQFINDDGQNIEIAAVIVRSVGSSIAAEITGIKNACYGNFRKLLVDNTSEPASIDTELIARDEIVPESY